MEVRAKKALGQHFLTDQKVARAIVDAMQPSSFSSLSPESPFPVLEVGPGMGVLSQYLLQREDIDLRLVEIDTESVEYLLTHFPGMEGKLLEADFLRLPLERIFPEKFNIIGNFPYNISSQIFFKVLDYKDSVPCVVGMVQKEVAERIAEGPGSKTYGILSVLLQAWYDIERVAAQPKEFFPKESRGSNNHYCYSSNVRSHLLEMQTAGSQQAVRHSGQRQCIHPDFARRK